MKSFDTNVAVRLVVEDDPAQCERAGRAFREAVDEGGVFFSATVLVEVLTSARNRGNPVKFTGEESAQAVKFTGEGAARPVKFTGEEELVPEV